MNDETRKLADELKQTYGGNSVVDRSIDEMVDRARMDGWDEERIQEALRRRIDRARYERSHG